MKITASFSFSLFHPSCFKGACNCTFNENEWNIPLYLKQIMSISLLVIHIVYLCASTCLILKTPHDIMATTHCITALQYCPLVISGSCANERKSLLPFIFRFSPFLKLNAQRCVTKEPFVQRYKAKKRPLVSVHGSPFLCK